MKYSYAKLKLLQQTWELFKSSSYFDIRSTVNPRYIFTEEFISNLEFIEELNGVFLLLSRAWVEKDGSQVSLIDYIFDPENYHSEIIKQLFGKVGKRLTNKNPKASIGINVDSRLTEYLDNITKLGFKEVIRLSEMQLNMQGEFDLSNINFAFKLRTPKEEELRAVYEMIFKTQIKGTIGEMEPSDEDYQDFLTNEIKNIELCTFVWDQEKIIAQITAVIIDDYAEIRELGVLPDYWRKGIATHIIKLTLNKIFKSGFQIVRLHSDSYNRYGALNIYKKLGFELLYESIRLRYNLKNNC
jgi:ribosomal protein S18 acetylase RimI-like enzyme